MIKKALGGRNLIVVVLVLGVGLASNWPLKYRDYAAFTAFGAELVDKVYVDVKRPEVGMAGFPFTYRVVTSTEGAGPLIDFSYFATVSNALCWLGLLAVMLAYGKLNARRSSKNEGRRQLSLGDLLILVAIAAGGFAVERSLNARAENVKSFIADIQARGGFASSQILLPEFLGESLGGVLGSRFPSVAAVAVNLPPKEMLDRIVRQPMLRRLHIGGGGCSSAHLEEIGRKALLWELRISGRDFSPQDIQSLAALAPQLQVLNLMRTNISAKGLESLGDMPRLKQICLVRTPIQLTQLPQFAWLDTIESLVLPHPKSGQGDELLLEGYRNLKQIQIVEYDLLRNDEPVQVRLHDLPKLEALNLDMLQKFDLDIQAVPSLRLIEGVDLQGTSRVRSASEVPLYPWLGEVVLKDAPVLESLNIWGQGLESFHITQCPNLALGVGTDTQQSVETGRARSGIEALEVGLPLETRQGWVNSLAGSDVSKADLSFLDLSDLDFAVLSSNEKLSRLDISNCNLSDELLSLRGMPALRELVVEFTALEGRHLKHLVNVMPELEVLSVDRRAMRQLELSDRRNLRQLFADNGAQNLSNVRRLSLINMPNLVEEIDIVAQIQSCEVINCPSMVGMSFRAPLPKGSRIGGFRDLKYFAGGGPEVDDTLVRELARCADLRELTLAYASASSEAIAELANCSKLTRLRLVGCQLDDAAAAKILASTSLELLDVRDTLITESSTALLVNHKSLSSIDIGRTPAVRGALQFVGKGRAQLEHLGLAGANPTVSDALQLEKLNIGTLDLSDAVIGEDFFDVVTRSTTMVINTLIVRNVNAPDIRLDAILHGLEQVDVTGAEFEPRSMDRIMSSYKVTETLESVPLGQFSSFVVYSSRPGVPKSKIDIDTRWFNPKLGTELLAQLRNQSHFEYSDNGFMLGPSGAVPYGGSSYSAGTYQSGGSFMVAPTTPGEVLGYFIGEISKRLTRQPSQFEEF